MALWSRRVMLMSRDYLGLASPALRSITNNGNNNLFEVGRLDSPRSGANYDTGQLFLHKEIEEKKSSVISAFHTKIKKTS